MQAVKVVTNQYGTFPVLTDPEERRARNTSRCRRYQQRRRAEQTDEERAELARKRREREHRAGRAYPWPLYMVHQHGFGRRVPL